LKFPNLLVIISLISFSVTLITASPFISYTNFFENNSNIFLKFPSIYAQDDGGGVEDNGDGGGDGGGVEDNDVGNEGINENTNDFSPLSFDSPTNPDDEVNQTEQQQQQLEQQIVDIDVDQHADQTSQQQAFGADVEQK
jgi:hypothetical protein